MSEQVGVGASFWDRRTNKYAGCSCPPARYNPRQTKLLVVESADDPGVLDTVLTTKRMGLDVVNLSAVGTA